VKLLYSTVCLSLLITFQQASADDSSLPSGAAGFVQVLGDEAAQTVLKLNDEQKAAVQRAAELLKQVRDGKAQFMAVEMIRESLTADQFKAAMQLFWKRLGTKALFEPQVRKRLEITAEQSDKLSEAQAVNEKEHLEMVDFMRRARFRSAEAMAEYKKKYSDAADERLVAVLADKQREMFKTLTASGE
jgi:hypothetical protein